MKTRRRLFLSFAGVILILTPAATFAAGTPITVPGTERGIGGSTNSAPVVQAVTHKASEEESYTPPIDPQHLFSPGFKPKQGYTGPMPHVDIVYNRHDGVPRN